MMKPKIRFKGFEGEWKDTNLGNISNNFKYGINAAAIPYDGKNKYLRITDIDDTTHVFLQDNLTSPGADLSYCDEYIMQDGDIVIARTGASVGKSYVYHTVDGKIYFAGFLIRVRTNKEVNKDFIFQKTLTNAYTKHIQFVSQRSGQPGVNVNELKSFSFLIPRDKEEQQAIASYFTSLDSQISAATSRLASLKQMKAASLQAMFPQEGETVPKIRFKGFEGEWKTCILSSIATMHARIGWQNLRKDEFLSSGAYYLITGTDFHDGKISFETCHYIDKERYDQDKNIQLEIDSILITKDGTLGKVAFVDSLDKPATLNAGVFNVRTKDKEIYPKYLFQYLKAPYLMDYVNKNATGGTIKHLNQNMLVNFPVQHPSYKEQVMIGDYLFNLDRQISLQSQRLEKLKQIKSACLDKMFV